MSLITPLSQEMSSSDSMNDQIVEQNMCENPNATFVMLHIDHVEHLHQHDSLICCKHEENESVEEDLPTSTDECDNHGDNKSIRRKASWIKWTTDYLGLTDSTCGLKSKLLNFFKTLTLPRVAWLDEGVDMPIKDYYMKLQLNDNKEEITVEKTFKKENGVRPRRILIEGQPGYGKTTLATKIAYDWASREKYLEKYDMLFLIPLRVLQGKTIYSAIKSVAYQSGFRSEDYDVIDIIDYNASKTMLILDGLDEVSSNDRESILKILYKQIFSEVTVVVTCRRGLFKLEREERDVLFGEISRTRDFHDRKITVLGVNHRDRRIFLQKFTSTENADKVIAHLDKLTEPVAEIFKSPLLVILLAFIAQKKKEIVIASKTDLYKNLFNCMIRQSLEKSGVNVTEDFDLFDFNDKRHENYKNLFSKFGKLALDHINSNNMQFKETDLTKNLYQLGFLIRHNSVVPFESKQYYEAIHLSILEFAAAVFLVKDYQENNLKFSVESLKILRQLFRYVNSTSFVLPFLVGLMGKNSNDLFFATKSTSDLFATNSATFWNIIQEQYPTTVAMDDMVDFLPRCVFVSPELSHIFFSSFLWGDVMNKGIRSGKVAQLKIDNGELWKLPRNSTVPLLWVVIPQTSPSIMLYNDQSSCIRDFQCEKLLLQFQKNLRRDAEIKQYFLLLNCVRTEHKTLWLQDESTHDILFKNVKTGLFNNVKLQFLYCELTQERNTLQFLEILLKNNQVEELEVKVHLEAPHGDVDKLIEIVSSSQNLNSFTLIESVTDRRINFNQLIQNGKKKWKRLMIAGGELICDPIPTEGSLIDLLVILQFTNVNNFANVIPTLSTPTFCCNAKFLKAILERTEPSCLWYKSVTELGVDVNDTSDVWSKLTLFTEVKILQIACRNDSRDALPFGILDSLRQLQISKLKILWQDYGLRFVTDFFAGEKGLMFKSSIPKTLKSVELFPTGNVNQDKFDGLFLALGELVDCLKKGILQEISIYSEDEMALRKIVQWEFIDIDVFDFIYSGDVRNNYSHALLWGYTIYTAKLTIKLK